MTNLVDLNRIEAPKGFLDAVNIKKNRRRPVLKIGVISTGFVVGLLVGAWLSVTHCRQERWVDQVANTYVVSDIPLAPLPDHSDVLID